MALFVTAIIASVSAGLFSMVSTNLENEKNMISKKWYVEIFSDEYPPYKITKNLIDDGRKYLLMNQQI